MKPASNCRTVLHEDPQAPLMDRLQARPIAGGVVREVLRLNPPVALLQRRTLRATVVDGQPLPEGALLTLVPLHVQRDAQWWPQPDVFDPQRHLAEADPAPSGAFAPFGGGVHPSPNRWAIR